MPITKSTFGSQNWASKTFHSLTWTGGSGALQPFTPVVPGTGHPQAVSGNEPFRQIEGYAKQVVYVDPYGRVVDQCGNFELQALNVNLVGGSLGDISLGSVVLEDSDATIGLVNQAGAPWSVTIAAGTASIGSVDLGNETAPGWGGTGKTTVGTSAVQLTDSSIAALKGVLVRASHDNEGIVYVGTSAEVTTDTGYPLRAADSVKLPLANADLVYLIADEADQEVRFAAI